MYEYKPYRWRHELQLATDIKQSNKNMLHLQNHERVERKKGKFRLIDCGEGMQISTGRKRADQNFENTTKYTIDFNTEIGVQARTVEQSPIKLKNRSIILG